MDIVKNYLLTPKPWASVAVIAVCFVLWIVIKKAVGRFAAAKAGEERHAKNLRLGAKAIKYIIIFFAVVTVLQINGINVSSLITGLGVAGIVVGFALEDLLKDIINGANIVLDGFFSVGDMVIYRSGSAVIEGRVTSFSLKATKIYDINTGNTVIISNRNITEIEQMSDLAAITVPSPYEVPASKMREVCLQLCLRIKKLEGVTACEFLGTDEFAASQISYKLLMHCDPSIKNRCRRAAMGAIQDALAENGIDIPFNRLDVSLVEKGEQSI